MNFPTTFLQKHTNSINEVGFKKKKCNFALKNKFKDYQLKK